MFNWFKKKDKIISQKEVQPSTVSEAELNETILDYEKRLTERAVADDATILWELADCYQQVGRVEEAITLYEQLSQQGFSQKAYRSLLTLYNQARILAAQRQDQDKVEYYLQKLDELRQMGKGSIFKT